MRANSNNSRERILSRAEELILQKGFSSTSIDDILKRAAITKGGFFYHFDGKAGLAYALVERYLEQDDIIFSDLFAKAESLSEEPLHQLLIFLKLFADMMSEMETSHPGCLVASFTYEGQQLNDNVKELMNKGIIEWRTMIKKRLNPIFEQNPLQDKISIDTLADMFTSSVEGGIILAKAFNNNALLVNQILAYRLFLRTLFDVK